MFPIMVSSASLLLRRLCSQQPNSTGLSPAMRRPCKDGTSYIVIGCDWYVRLHGNIHSKPQVPSWMPNEHYFSLGLEHRYDRFLTPHSRGTFIYLCLVRWWAFFSCGNMLGHQFSLTWHSGHQECMVPGVAWNSLIYAVMTVRTHWDCDLCVLWAIYVLQCPADIALYHIGTSQNPFLGEN